MDNQILVYSTRDKLKLNNKKSFKGHINAGYAMGTKSFSVDLIYQVWILPLMANMSCLALLLEAFGSGAGTQQKCCFV